MSDEIYCSQDNFGLSLALTSATVMHFARIACLMENTFYIY
jgi:hypothetical protein